MTAPSRAIVLEISSLGRDAGARLALNGPRASVSDHRQVTAAWVQRLSGWVRGVVRLRAWENESLHDDLEQAAYLCLVEMDPSRLTPADDPWVKRRMGYAIKMALADELAHHHPGVTHVSPDDVSDEDIMEAPGDVMEARLFRKNRRRRRVRIHEGERWARPIGQ